MNQCVADAHIPQMFAQAQKDMEQNNFIPALFVFSKLQKMRLKIRNLHLFCAWCHIQLRQWGFVVGALQNELKNFPDNATAIDLSQQINATMDIRTNKLQPQIALAYFCVSLVEQCNLNCWGCLNYSPLAHSEYLDIAIFERDFRRLSELSGGNVIRIGLLGGEPLLHPNIIEFLPIARKYFPHSVIEIVTNGLLLTQQSSEFWQACKEYNIDIEITKYPINLDHNKIAVRAAEFGANWGFYGDAGDQPKRLDHGPVDLNGSQNEGENFLNCFQAQSCCVLQHGKMYTCSTPASIRHFNNHFGLNIPVTAADSVDIHQANNIEEVLTFLAKPIPMCKFCNIKKRSYGCRPWGTSTKNINEWTTPEQASAHIEQQNRDQRFENDAYKVFMVAQNQYYNNTECYTASNIPQTQKVKRVSFQLSNMCNYTHLHKKCPVAHYTEKKVLSSEIIYKVIDELVLWNFSGIIGFHRYNEPLMDPRLFMFMQLVNMKLPNAQIHILTNGSYLTQEILDSLAMINNCCVNISSYSHNEHKRLIKLTTSMPYCVFPSFFDDRENIYDCPLKNIKSPCYAPLRETIITCEGKVGLCCLDWQDRFTFGNLNTQTLSQIINSQKLIDFHKKLVNAERCASSICQRCDLLR